MSAEYTLYNHSKQEYLELGKRYSKDGLPPFQRFDVLAEYLKQVEITSQGLTLKIVSDVHDPETLKEEYTEVFPEDEANS